MKARERWAVAWRTARVTSQEPDRPFIWVVARAVCPEQRDRWKQTRLRGEAGIRYYARLRSFLQLQGRVKAYVQELSTLPLLELVSHQPREKEWLTHRKERLSAQKKALITAAKGELTKARNIRITLEKQEK